MALYQPQKATLNGIEGEGYAYVEDTYQGKAYRGVFFCEDGDECEAVAAADDPVAFNGIVYHKSREKVEELEVNVLQTLSVSVGTRADFEVVET